MTTLNKYIKKNVIPYAAYLTFFIVIYISVITTVYGFSDDYANIKDGQTQILPITKMIIQGGRPVYALLNYAFTLTHDVSDLVWIRLFGIAGIAALCTLFMKHLKEATDLPSPVCIMLAACIGLMPPFQVYAAWATTSFFAWSAFLAGLSFRLLCRQAEPNWKNSLGALILLSLAICTYQPSAMMYWVFAGTTWLASDRPLPSLKSIFVTCAIMGGALVIDFAATKILPPLLFHDFHSLPRTALVSNIGKKCTWFVSKVMRCALNLASVKENLAVSIFSFLFISSGLYFCKKNSQYFDTKKICIWFILIPLTYLPNLLVKECIAPYRSQAALTSLMLLYFTLALCRGLHVNRRSNLITPCMGLVFIVCSYTAYSNVKNGFAFQQSTELKLASEYLSQTDNLSNSSSLYFVTSKQEQTFTPSFRYHEFGLPSTSQEWVPASMIWILLNTRHSPNIVKLKTARVGPLADAPKQPDVTIVNFEQILRNAHLH
ncbi:hypothetical protein GOB86_01850 [Acetobacter lambici]|uniref:Glycosyltransferase RgtA/B/C/D-like domain-containing protein n=1 Tax=Acetobacter lambici TaxID=1332824 RepID=A0ABT1EWT6_9PROT|nr:hypothetical protein [Acetobacter lambici]MCP1240985.1 hypothetical protein [Acetobacter lambici]MCP1257343.1 hypothetical protein [Acetobacter lambici]NHO55832.1 hypothetical protein [Acetobacter lambici]